MMARKRHYFLPATEEERIGGYQNRACLLLRHNIESCLDLAIVARFHDSDRSRKHPPAFLDIFKLGVRIGVGRIDQNSEAAGGRDKLLQQPEPFCLQGRRKEAYAGHVAAWSIEALDQSEPQRIAAIGKHHRNVCTHRFCCECRIDAAARGEHGHFTAYEVRDQSRQPIVMAFRITVFDQDVTTLVEPGLAEPLTETGRRWGSRRSTVEKPDHRDLWLLRPCHDRPCRGAAEQGDERAASQSSADEIRSLHRPPLPTPGKTATSICFRTAPENGHKIKLPV